MSFVVNVEQFDGPLDLMLHLIKEEKLDIFNLDINVLTDQYIAYLHQMEKMQLDIASEYLVELATLIEYKSKKLLPTVKSELEEDYEKDNEDELVRRLLEYKRYKEVTSQFDQLFQSRNMLHDKPQSQIANQWDNKEETFSQGNPYQLIKAMKRVLARYNKQNPYEVSVATQRMSIEDRTVQLKEKVRRFKGVFTLENTMEDCKDSYEVVVTFMSILVMINENYLTFSVGDNEQIYFEKGTQYE